MKVNAISVILIMAFLYPIIRGYILNFSSIELKSDIISVEGDMGLIAAIISGLFFFRRIFVQHNYGIYDRMYRAIPPTITDKLEDNPYLLYLIVLPIIVLILYEIIKLFFYLINMVIIFPFLDVLERALGHKSNTIKRFISSIFEIPRAICVTILLAVLFNIAAFMNLNAQFNDYLSRSEIYNYICKDIIVPIANSKLARQIPNIINNSIKIEVKEAAKSIGGSDSVIIYYNGITLDEGIQSNEAIDSFARSLVADVDSEYEKAKIIYEWIGRNLEYDNEKATRILNNDFSVKSGAIAAYNEKKGICFDYTCLYIAMCRAVNLDVRMITGEGFNGVSWITHAWNQVLVYGKWINVDTTFYKGGNYFDSSRFGLDHRNSSIAGEWR
ncbi:transglutaminase domain-containing protein [Clostridium thermarum]|uniref:transglutaminase domain-containing protein n=1 Tax=Clostridium thermarum TaxID=1716543 RepID=UPI0011221344|nr:transglutaminase-like domain-containing protein [Clostridium thermarum]